MDSIWAWGECREGMEDEDDFQVGMLDVYIWEHGGGQKRYRVKMEKLGLNRARSSCLRRIQMEGF